MYIAQNRIHRMLCLILHWKQNNNKFISMIKIKRELLVCILSVGSLVSWANDIQPTDTLTVEIYYRQGISQIDSTYQDNRNRMGKLLEFLYTLSADSTCRLNGLHIISGASPEGNTSFNKALSKKKNQCHQRLPQPATACRTIGFDYESSHRHRLGSAASQSRTF